MSYKTDLILIIDESGSMMPQRLATIAALNELVQYQKRLPGDLAITTVMFNSEARVPLTRVRAVDFPPFTSHDYDPMGATALIDTACEVLDVAAQWESPPETVTIVVIVTDGESNSDFKYKASDLKSRVAALEVKGWKFVYIGSGLDAFKMAGEYGITIAWQADLTTAAGTAMAYRGVNETVSLLRSLPLLRSL